MAAVSTREIRKQFGDVHAVNGISLVARDGEFVVLLGPSGCGKSTLLRIINGLVPMTAGQVVYRGRQVDGINRVCALVSGGCDSASLHSPPRSCT